MAKHLHEGDETLRWKTIDASRSADASLLPQLLARLDGDETYESRRHIVRALGNIGGPRAEAKLLELLDSEPGLIIGDITRALGEIGCRRAAPPLEDFARPRIRVGPPERGVRAATALGRWRISRCSAPRPPRAVCGNIEAGSRRPGPLRFRALPREASDGKAARSADARGLEQPSGLG